MATRTKQQDATGAGPTLYTIGHSRRSLDELLAMLREVGVTRLIDIRKIPRSRSNPQFNPESLAPALAQEGIAYEASEALGGRRGKQQGSTGRNDAWEVQAFRNYADYADGSAFADGLRQLLERAAGETCAIMCAEAVWWRCHRRIVTDHVLAQGRRVEHLMAPGRREAARLTPFARVGKDGAVTYPARSARALREA